MRQRDSAAVFSLLNVLTDPAMTKDRLEKLLAADVSLSQKIQQYQQIARDNEARAKALDAREKAVTQREHDAEGQQRELEVAKQAHNDGMTVEQSKLAKAQADHQAKIDAEQSLLASQWEKLNEQSKALLAKEKALQAIAAKLEQRTSMLDDRETGLRQAQSDLSTRITRMREIVGN